MRPKRLLILVACTAINADLGQAQVASTIGSGLACSSCSIVIDRNVTLHGVDFAAGPATLIDRDAAGAIYVVDARDGLLKVFGNDGRLLREIGRHGGAPGEYEDVRNVLVAPDGSIHVLDGTLGRRSVFSQLGTLLRTTPFPVQGGVGMPALLLPDDQLIINGIFQQAADVGNALLRVDERGKRSLAFDEGAFDFRERWRQRRLLWRRANGELLVAHPYSFLIDVYSADLRKNRSIARNADWIPAQERQVFPEDGLFGEAYTPRLRALWEDAEGRLWLYMMIPSPSWQPVVPVEKIETLSPQKLSELADRPRVETIIEVLDTKAGRVLARSHIDGSVGLPFGGGYFAQPVTDSEGVPSVVISRVRLTIK